jgi:hypothetical protein
LDAVATRPNHLLDNELLKDLARVGQAVGKTAGFPHLRWVVPCVPGADLLVPWSSVWFSSDASS